jgi:hypothetical protein
VLSASFASAEAEEEKEEATEEEAYVLSDLS